MFTLFRQRVGDVEVIIVEVQQFHRSLQSELGLLYLLGYGVHGDLTRTEPHRLLTKYTFNPLLCRAHETPPQDSASVENLLPLSPRLHAECVC